MKVEVPTQFVLRLISPGVVGLVTSEYRGRMDVTTIGWMMPAGREPPLVAIAVHPSTLCHDLIRRSGEFAINVPTLDVLNQVLTCGRLSGNEVDKFARTGLQLAEPRVIRAPLIDQCIGHLECAVVNAFQPGDHTIFIGAVASATVEEDLFEDTWILRERDRRPLHHLGGSWFGVLEERIEAKSESPSE
jgi:flavin reductase (DIM6/NTAB) family NADH-FMN oxidoreductase RutF